MKNARSFLALPLLFSLLAAPFSASALAKGYAPVYTPASTGGGSIAIRANADAVMALSKINNNVNVTGSIIANIASGVSVAAVATGAISGASAGGAWGAAAGVAGVVALAAIPAIQNWMHTASLEQTNGHVFKITTGRECLTGCLEYFDGAGESAAWFRSPEAAGASYAGYATGRDRNFTYTLGACADHSCVLYGTGKVGSDGEGASITSGVSFFTRATPPYTDSSRSEITLGQAVQEMSAQAPTVEAVQALIDAGFAPAVAPVTVTGPAKSPDVNTVKLGADGSTIKETCAYYLEYFPSNITEHPECSSTTATPAKTDTRQVTTTNTDGSTSTQVISTTTPASTTTATTKSDVTQDTPAIDTALPDLPKLYTAKYPDGLVGVWAAQKAALSAAPLVSLVGKLMPTVAAGGSCPTMFINFNLASWANFGSHDIAPPCYIWDICAVIIVLSSLLLARALIFGG